MAVNVTSTEGGLLTHAVVAPVMVAVGLAGTTTVFEITPLTQPGVVMVLKVTL